MKKFLLHISLVLLPLLCIPFVNYTVDPGHLYGGYEQEVASSLEGHRYVINVAPNFDYRSFKRSLIDSCKRNIDVLLLGSSSVLFIAEDVLDNKTSLNLGVPGATFNDMAGLYYYYLQKHGSPKTVIIALDPQQFNPVFGDPRWKALLQPYKEFSQKVLLEDVPLTLEYERWINLLSLSYFKESVVAYLWTKKMEILYGWDFTIRSIDRDVIYADVENGAALAYDGSIIVHRDPELQNPPVYERVTLEKPVGTWEYPEVSQEAIDHFSRLIQFIQNQGTKVYLFKSPYLAILYDRVMTEPRYVGARKALECFDKLAEENNVDVIGANDPSVLNLTDYDFHDAVHLRRSRYGQILSHYVIE